MKKSFAFCTSFALLLFAALSVCVSADIDISELKLIVTPERPNPGEAVSLRIVEKDNDTIGRERVRVYDPDWERLVDKFVSEGKVDLTSSNTKELGSYKVSVEGYTGSLNFSVKDDLWYAGPNPADPVVGERITFGVPQGVGVKVFDSNGDLYIACRTLLDDFGRGQVNFTIDFPGTYEVRIGEISKTYWGENIGMTVLDKNKFETEMSPENPVNGEALALTVKSNGAPVEGASVRILTPGGRIDEKTTSSDGKVSYVPEEMGEYTVTLEKPRYEKYEGKFLAYDVFEMEFQPDEIEVGETATVIVKNSAGVLVNNADFCVAEKGINESTNSDGKVLFSISEKGTYGFRMEKIGFWTLNGSIEVLLPSKLVIRPEKIEFGDTIRIETWSGNEKFPSEKTMEKPSGQMEVIGGEEYMPPEIGAYGIRAKGAGYKTANGTFDVMPHPLSVSSAVERGNLVIKVASHGIPVPEIEIFMETPLDTQTLITNDDGVAEIGITEGDYRIYANYDKRDGLYEERIITGSIKKEYSLSTLLLMILAILLVATLLITRPWEKGKGGSDEEGEDGSGGKSEKKDGKEKVIPSISLRKKGPSLRDV